MPVRNLRRRHILGQIHTFETGKILGHLVQRGGIGFAVGADRPVRHALGADAIGQRASVDAGNPRNIVAFEPGIEALQGAPVGRHSGRGAHDHPAHHGLERFHVLVVGADDADMRKGEADDLPGIRGIGKDFLIAGHRGVEANLAHRAFFRPEAAAVEYRPVGENQPAAQNGLRTKYGGER